MFQNKRLDFISGTANSGKKNLLRRGILLGAGLFLLWAALYIMPRSDTSKPDPFARSSTPEPGPTQDSLQALASLSTPGPEDANSLLASNAPNPTARSSIIVQLGQALAALILIALLGYAFYRHKQTAKERVPIKGLQTLGRLQLGSNQHVYLVGCGDDAFLISATGQQMTLLKSFSLDSIRQSHATSPYPVPIINPYSNPSSTQISDTDFALILDSYSKGLANQAHFS